MYSPKFQISQNILKYIGIIEGAREVIANAPLVPSWEKKFQEDAIVRQVHHGTHLEGNALNISEAAQVVAGNEVIGRPRDIQEVINYRNVIDYIDQLSSPREKNFEIDTDLLFKLHTLTTDRILPPEKVGKYRLGQVVIRNSQSGEISFKPPQSVEVPILMDEFLDWLDNHSADIHPVLTSGIAQYEMVRIHPFVDGNGRLARSVATLILYQKGYDIRRFFSMEEYYDKNAVEYYKALQSVPKRDGDLTVWLEYFCEGLAIELTRIKERIQKLSADIHLKEKLGGKQIFLTERQIKIVEHLQTIGYLQNKMFPQLFSIISEDTSLREIADLIEKGILIKRGKTKGARYVLKS